MEKYIIDKDKVTFVVSEQIYPLESILKTAYIFIDNYYVFLDKKEQDQLIVEISPKNNCESTLEKTVGEFYNELLNQLLRLCISNNTRTLRELITTRALYSSYIHENEIVSEPENNPYDIEEIAINWFEGNVNGK